jgi:hypothetical protein
MVMRLEDTKRQKRRPTAAQRPQGPRVGRPRTTMKEFVREGATALRVRRPLSGEAGGGFGKWLWVSLSGYVDLWWQRSLMSVAQAKGHAEALRFEGAEVKLITVWRKPRDW